MITSKDAIKAFGLPIPSNERKCMVLWDVPQDINDAIPTIPNRIYCNRLLVKPLEDSFRKLIAKGLQREIVTWDGCFNVRKKRKYSDWSLHSWGLAIDINAAWNQQGKIPTLSKELVECFTSSGFYWGGFWLGKNVDGMHFELSEL